MTDLITLGQRAKEASRKLATSPETLRNAALEAIAAALEEQAETIIAGKCRRSDCRDARQD